MQTKKPYSIKIGRSFGIKIDYKNAFTSYVVPQTRPFVEYRNYEKAIKMDLSYFTKTHVN